MASYEMNNADLEATQSQQQLSKGHLQKIHVHIRSLEIGIAVMALVNVSLCGVAVALFNRQSVLVIPNILDNPFMAIGQLIVGVIVILGCLVALFSRVRGPSWLRLGSILILVAANLYMTVKDVQFLKKSDDSQDPVGPVYCGVFVAAAELTRQSGFSAMNLCRLETAIQVFGVFWTVGLLIEGLVKFLYERRSGAPQTETEHQASSALSHYFQGENAMPTSRLEQYFGKNYEAVMNGSVKVTVPVPATAVKPEQSSPPTQH
ncbi:hypothetical protein BGZ83_002084 [Gryganskiella cystojenkinii]|nr:hypothetical protein BGZ83_002084 [Gryganskiella cystojenkinii]